MSETFKLGHYHPGGLGIVLRLVAALGVTRLMTGFLYGIQSADPLTFAAVPLGLLTVALLACHGVF